MQKGYFFPFPFLLAILIKQQPPQPMQIQDHAQPKLPKSIQPQPAQLMYTYTQKIICFTGTKIK